MREAAGDRFDAIELNALIQFVVHTDDREASAAELAAAFGGISPEFVLDSPFVLLGTHEQMAEMLVERQQRFGVSYWTVFDEWVGPDLRDAGHRESHCATTLAATLGAGVGLVVHRPQPGDGDVRVQLRGSQRRVAEQFLHDAQVRAALEQMGGGAVAQPVRADVGRTVDRGDRLVHDGACLTRIEPAPTCAEQQRRARVRGGQCGRPSDSHAASATCAGSPNGTVRCLLPLPSTRSSRRGRVDVVDVEPAQLADPNTGGVQQLDDQPVPQCKRISLLCTGFRRGHRVERLILSQHCGQAFGAPWASAAGWPDRSASVRAATPMR